MQNLQKALKKEKEKNDFLFSTGLVMFVDVLISHYLFKDNYQAFLILFVIPFLVSGAFIFGLKTNLYYKYRERFLVKSIFVTAIILGVGVYFLGNHNLLYIAVFGILFFWILTFLLFKLIRKFSLI